MYGIPEKYKIAKIYALFGQWFHANVDDAGSYIHAHPKWSSSAHHKNRVYKKNTFPELGVEDF